VQKFSIGFGLRDDGTPYVSGCRGTIVFADIESAVGYIGARAGTFLRADRGIYDSFGTDVERFGGKLDTEPEVPF
jgi:hypothetical protein